MKLYWTLVAVFIFEWWTWLPPPETHKYLWQPSRYAKLHGHEFYFQIDQNWINPNDFQIRLERDPLPTSWTIGVYDKVPGCFFGRDDGTPMHAIYCRVWKWINPLRGIK